MNMEAIRETGPTLRVQDQKLDDLGNIYRLMCGGNDVLVMGGRVVTFEGYVLQHLAWEEQRAAA
jgi:hypothetical protein